MAFRRIRWRIAVPYLVLVIAAMTLSSTYVVRLVEHSYTDALAERMVAEARLIRSAFEPYLLEGDVDALREQTARLEEVVAGRVTIIAPDGQVLADTVADPDQMKTHLYRPEVQQAIREGVGRGTHFSDSVGYEMMYVAIRVPEGDPFLGFVRLALPMEQIGETVSDLRRAVRWGAWIIALVTLALAILIADRTARPVLDLTRVVERMAQGDLEARLLPATRDEVGKLTGSVNQMAGALRETVSSLERERGQLAAVLEHMADGALIIGEDGLVSLLNPAARRILDIPESTGIGRSLAEVVRQHGLWEAWDTCRTQQQEQVDLIEVGNERLFLQVIVTPLGDHQSGDCLMIIQDLTQVRRLEMVRQQFISNISHELRTPLASLRALADTLRDGAMDDPPAAARFLDGINAEVDSMTQMVQELLELSRIESGRVPIVLEPAALEDVMLAVAQRLDPLADRSGVELSVVLPPDLPYVLADADRLEQVITNLVHNAIRYTPAEGRVVVSARLQGEQVMVSVRDTGIGIPREDLPHIFERFFKTDRSRSRSRSGTGLGLAIASHIVKAHGGTLAVESVEGKGSTFSFALHPSDIDRTLDDDGDDDDED